MSQPATIQPAPPSTAPSTKRPVRQAAAPAPPPAPGPGPAVEKQRRWALTALIIVLGAGLVAGVAKRRAR